MRIVISALGDTLDAAVDDRFGRADHLLLIDTTTMAIGSIDNTANQRALKGAGLGAAEVVSLAGVEAVLTGHLGPNAYRALQAAGIPSYGVSGMNVRQAVELFEAEELELLTEGEPNAGM